MRCNESMLFDVTPDVPTKPPFRRRSEEAIEFVLLGLVDIPDMQRIDASTLDD